MQLSFAFATFVCKDRDPSWSKALFGVEREQRAGGKFALLGWSRGCAACRWETMIEGIDDLLRSHIRRIGDAASRCGVATGLLQLTVSWLRTARCADDLERSAISVVCSFYFKCTYRELDLECGEVEQHVRILGPGISFETS